MEEINTEEKFEEIPPYTLIRGRYLTGGLLGKGASGCCYRAYDTVLEVETVIKEFVPLADFSAGIQEQKTLFLQEAGFFFGKYEYPGFSAVTDVFEEKGRVYLAGEYYGGGNLRDYLKKQSRGRITVEKALELLAPVFEALSYLHSTGMVHGGISMERLVFDEDGGLHLTGCGSCFLRKKEKDYGPWRDVQMVAEVIYECLTGKMPDQAVSRYFPKGSLKPLHHYITVSERVERAVLTALNKEPAARYFSIGSFAENLGVALPELAPYTGAIRALWGEQWLELTTDSAGEWSGRSSFLTWKKWKRLLIAGAFLVGTVGVLLGGGYLYLRNHPETVLQYETARFQKEYAEHPVFRIAAGDPEYEAVWSSASAQGEREGENAYEEEERYTLPREYFMEKQLISNVSEGFAISGPQLRKAAELVYETSLEKTGQSWLGSVARLSGRLGRLEITALDTLVYQLGTKDREKKLEIVSDAVSGRVESCTLSGDQEEVLLFLTEILPYVVPEAYITEAEAEALTDKAGEQGSCYLHHGKFDLTVFAFEPLEKGEEKTWKLQLNSWRSVEKLPEREARAGSYPRGSQRYEEFLDLVEKETLSKTEEEDRRVYTLSEKAVRQWGELSNVQLLNCTEKMLTDYLGKQGFLLKKTEEEDQIFVYDYGMGSLKTQFTKRAVYTWEDRTELKIFYDILSGRIFMIGISDTENEYERVLPLAADMLVFLSEEVTEDKETLAKMLKESMKEADIGNPVWEGMHGRQWSDVSGYIINPREKEERIWFIISRSSIVGDGFREICWPEA